MTAARSTLMHTGRAVIGTVAAVLGSTGLVTLLLAGYAWRVAPVTPVTGRVGLAAILAGATANIADRAADGSVTDYLFTTWWPTFNLADTMIILGGVLVVIATLREPVPSQGGLR